MSDPPDRQLHRSARGARQAARGVPLRRRPRLAGHRRDHPPDRGRPGVRGEASRDPDPPVGTVISFVEQIIKAIAPAYTSLGYVIVAAGVMAERSILVGLFVPGDVILALGGVYAGRGNLELWAVILIGTFA